ncbi:MAG: murein biosynthesis integral membrane protein MurJ [Patescibacteria group bacterium]|nr:murein biosynthesis integral membrane protein MurJ [Patescibacteria group bacterium]
MFKFSSIFKFGPIQNFTPAAFLIGGLSLVSSALGMIRDRILATHFGAGEALDMYYAAFRLPDLVFNILIFGALSSAFVPVFSQYLTKNKKQALKMASYVLNLVLISILVVSVICVILAPYLVKIIVPGFTAEKLQTTIELTRIMFFSPILLSISGVFSGILTTFKRFLIYALAPIMYNLGIIGGLYVFVPELGIYGLAWAVVLGAFCHMLIQLPGALSSGFRFSLKFNLRDKAIRKIGKLMIPRSLSLMVNQFNLLFATIVASTLMAGSLAVFNLANNLAGIPLTIFGAPFAVAVFPILAFSFNQKKMKKFKHVFSKAFVRISFFVIPATVMVLVLRAQLVRLVLGAGNFDWQDTVLTFQVLGFLALSLFFQSLLPLVSRAFFALHNTWIPFISGLIAAVINVTLAFFLGKTIGMGIGGVALAFSISQTLNLLIMLVILHVKLKGFEDQKIISTITKIVLASIAMGVAVQIMKYITGLNIGTDTFFKIFIQTIASSLGGVAIFLVLAWCLGIKEISAVKDLLGKLVKK